MNVESVGEKPINKKKWIILFSVLGVLIVGLIIAIVVVVINRNNSPETTEYTDQEYNDVLVLYFDDNEEIATTVVNQELNGEDMLKLLKEKIDDEKNEKTRAMLEEDYYTIMFSIYGKDESKRDEIINGLMRVEEILQTAESAEAVADAALGYNELDLYNKYVAFAKERNPDYKSVYEMVEGLSE
ncbi:MAG: hypothetical protein Q4F58_00595 [Candidatus Saccharibacteria bacterium]|nr:hypothetical protein [Candidatus Saccharibacteria bacterium]